ncbi:thioredoxin-like protein [Syncephalis plumigaleata]|nr:thioredoxin-like protein [Syncephalis plumigaleata]
MSSVQALVKDYINEHEVMVFSKTYCPYCSRAKQILQKMIAELGLTVKLFVLELDVEPNGAEIQNALLEISGQRTVPNIYINGKHVGGCDNVIQLQKDPQRQRELFGLS